MSNLNNSQFDGELALRNYDLNRREDSNSESDQSEEEQEMDATVAARMIEESQYYHGYLTRKVATELLKRDGDFLVRESNISQDNHAEIVLSIRWEHEFKHFRVQVDYRGYFSIDGHKYFQSLMDLVKFSIFHNRPLTRYSGAKLGRPIGLQWWELISEDLQMLPVRSGSGCFGTVYEGILKQKHEGNNVVRRVAVKTCERSSRKEREEFLREARIMRETQHPNIVQFLGISVFEMPLKILMGLAEHGNLQKYLTKTTEKGIEIPLRQKIRFGLDASRALEYLSDKGIIHMDIAARNCLLTEDEENGEMKVRISDFGLSRFAITYTIDKGQFISQRWAAPELLKDYKASVASDVWAFGILLWEIFSNGLQPYPDVCDNNLDFYLALENNNRMEPHPTAPPSVGALMAQCWETEPEKRPKFKKCRETLETAIKDNRNILEKLKQKCDVPVFV